MKARSPIGLAVSAPARPPAPSPAAVRAPGRLIQCLGLWLPLLAFASLHGPASAQAQQGPIGGIYTCVDGNGRRLTSDRPIPDCVAREQRLLNADGSVRKVVPPTLTAEERAAREAQERREALEAASRRDAARRDRNLMTRYPNEAAHQAGREQALQSTRRAVEASEARLKALAQERKPLLDESEFYAGRALPPKLRQQLDANDAAVRAQRDAVQTQRDEIARVNELFDIELERLRRLWSGAAPGSMGPLRNPGDATATAGASPASARPATPAASPSR